LLVDNNVEEESAAEVGETDEQNKSMAGAR
jgi:hypothetical protein